MVYGVELAEMVMDVVDECVMRESPSLHPVEWFGVEDDFHEVVLGPEESHFEPCESDLSRGE